MCRLEEDSSDAVPPKHRNRRFQFGLSALFLLTFLVAMASGWLKVFGFEGIRFPLLAAAGVTFGVITVGGPLLALGIACLAPGLGLRHLPAIGLSLFALWAAAGIGGYYLEAPPNAPIDVDVFVVLAVALVWWAIQGILTGGIYCYWRMEKTNQAKHNRGLPDRFPLPGEDGRRDD